MAVVYTDISGSASFSAGSLPVEGKLAYHESEECRAYTYAAGYIGCFKSGQPSSALAVEDSHSRAFLSVAAYLVLGPRSDAAAAQGSPQGGPEVWMDELGSALPGVGHIGPWYHCQSCGNKSAAMIKGGLITNGIRFGRSKSATYFVTSAGIVAKLEDKSTQATYVNCKD
jgi:hypothetical protein